MLLQKAPSRLETYNDLSNEIVSFFRILRDRPQELADLIRLTPWARDEYDLCWSMYTDDPLENARRLYCRLWMNVEGGLARKGSFRRQNKGSRSVTKDLRPDDLFAVSQRFNSVVIERCNAFDLIRSLDAPDALFYLDPPYLAETRTVKSLYPHELTDDEHLEFIDIVRSLKGAAIISGYPSPLYTNHLDNHGWRRIDRHAVVNNGGSRVESLWLSPLISI